MNRCHVEMMIETKPEENFGSRAITVRRRTENFKLLFNHKWRHNSIKNSHRNRRSSISSFMCRSAMSTLKAFKRSSLGGEKENGFHLKFLSTSASLSLFIVVRELSFREILLFHPYLRTGMVQLMSGFTRAVCKNTQYTHKSCARITIMLTTKKCCVCITWIRSVVAHMTLAHTWIQHDDSTVYVC